MVELVSFSDYIFGYLSGRYIIPNDISKNNNYNLIYKLNDKHFIKANHKELFIEHIEVKTDVIKHPITNEKLKDILDNEKIEINLDNCEDKNKIKHNYKYELLSAFDFVIGFLDSIGIFYNVKECQKSDCKTIIINFKYYDSYYKYSCEDKYKYPEAKHVYYFDEQRRCTSIVETNPNDSYVYYSYTFSNIPGNSMTNINELCERLYMRNHRCYKKIIHQNKM